MDRYIVVAALIAVAQAGFGNENIPIPAIQAVQGGEPGNTKQDLQRGRL